MQSDKYLEVYISFAFFNQSDRIRISLRRLPKTTLQLLVYTKVVNLNLLTKVVNTEKSVYTHKRLFITKMKY